MSTENKVQVQDWIAETPESITARLEGAKAAQAQIRLTIGLMALISMMMLIAAYNAYSSYDYGWTLVVTDRQAIEEKARKARVDEAAPKGPHAKAAAEREEADRQLAAKNTVAGILTEQALKDWASARIVQISLLGIRVSIDDAAVLGSVVLMVLSLWLLLVARREYVTIGSLLSDTDTPRPAGNRDPSTTTPLQRQSRVYSSGQRWLIFHTIVSNNLFATLDHSLSSVHPLGGRIRKILATRFKGKAAFGFVRTFFFLFPVVTLFIVFALDRLSYSLLRDPFLPNGAYEGTGRPFYWVSLAVFVVCGLVLLICSWESRRYSRETENLLQKYGETLRTDLLQPSAQI